MYQDVSHKLILFQPCKRRKSLCKGGGWCLNRALRNERDSNGATHRGISRQRSPVSCQGSPGSVEGSKCRVGSIKSLKLGLGSMSWVYSIGVDVNSESPK